MDRGGVAIASFTLSWGQIVAEFCRKFNEIYANTSSKAHLDISGVVVDGAKEKWFLIMLLDTIVAFYTNKEKRKHECERRRFDQYSALKESILYAAKNGQLFVLDRMQIALATTLVKCTLSNINGDWSSVDRLRGGLVHQQTSKSWRRRHQCTNGLCDYIKEKSVTEVLTAVVERVLLLDYASVTCFRNNDDLVLVTTTETDSSNIADLRRREEDEQRARDLIQLGIERFSHERLLMTLLSQSHSQGQLQLQQQQQQHHHHKGEYFVPDPSQYPHVVQQNPGYQHFASSCCATPAASIAPPQQQRQQWQQLYAAHPPPTAAPAAANASSCMSASSRTSSSTSCTSSSTSSTSSSTSSSSPIEHLVQAAHQHHQQQQLQQQQQLLLQQQKQRGEAQYELEQQEEMVETLMRSREVSSGVAAGVAPTLLTLTNPAPPSSTSTAGTATTAAVTPSNPLPLMSVDNPLPSLMSVDNPLSIPTAAALLQELSGRKREFNCEDSAAMVRRLPPSSVSFLESTSQPLSQGGESCPMDTSSPSPATVPWSIYEMEASAPVGGIYVPPPVRTSAATTTTTTNGRSTASSSRSISSVASTGVVRATFTNDEAKRGSSRSPEISPRLAASSSSDINREEKNSSWADTSVYLYRRAYAPLNEFEFHNQVGAPL